MKLSTKGRYGLRAMADIAAHCGEGVVSIGDISRRQQLSEHYLEQLLPKLRKAGLVISTRGAGGGYALTRPPSEISVGEILRALEGDVELVDCRGFSPDSGCAAAERCVTKYMWKKLNDNLRQTVDTTSLQELLDHGGTAAGKPENRGNCNE